MIRLCKKKNMKTIESFKCWKVYLKMLHQLKINEQKKTTKSTKVIALAGNKIK